MICYQNTQITHKKQSMYTLPYLCTHCDSHSSHLKNGSIYGIYDFRLGIGREKNKMQLRAASGRFHLQEEGADTSLRLFVPQILSTSLCFMTFIYF